MLMFSQNVFLKVHLMCVEIACPSGFLLHILSILTRTENILHLLPLKHIDLLVGQLHCGFGGHQNCILQQDQCPWIMTAQAADICDAGQSVNNNGQSRGNVLS